MNNPNTYYKPNFTIPLSKPYMGEEEIRAASKSILSGNIKGQGEVGIKLQDFMKDLFNIKSAILTTSGTHALELALMTLDIKEKDEAILPSFSFVSCATAIVRQGARPIFTDIEEEYLNIDPEKIEEKITEKTRAIICIHYGGVGCQMREILEIARRYNLYVIEDAAHAIGSKYDDKYLGTIGDIGCFSFHETKNVSCGEGGAFLTKDDTLTQRAEIIVEKGTNRLAFLRGDVDKYTWVDKGSSYVLSDILAAVLFEQIKKMPFINKKRELIGMRYLEGLRKLEENGKIILPKLNPDNTNWHIFYIRVKAPENRDRIINALRERGIEASFHFLPLHLSPYARTNYNYSESDFPITEMVSNSLIRLPTYPDLTESEQEYIIDSLYDIFK